MAALMVFVVVGGSFALSRVNRPGPRPELHGGTLRADEVVASEEALFDNAGADVDEGAELIAQATFDEAADVGEPPAEPASDEGSGNDDSLRIEIQTRDPNVRIIWFSPTGDHPSGVED
jgi:hypothetical protein